MPWTCRYLGLLSDSCPQFRDEILHCVASFLYSAGELVTLHNHGRSWGAVLREQPQAFVVRNLTGSSRRLQCPKQRVRWPFAGAQQYRTLLCRRYVVSDKVLFRDLDVFVPFIATLAPKRFQLQHGATLNHPSRDEKKELDYFCYSSSPIVKSK